MKIEMNCGIKDVGIDDGFVTREYCGEPKLSLTFDKVPKFILASEDGIKFELLIDGESVKGIRSLTVRGAYDDFMTHEIEYLTAHSGDGIRK
jgi:hypothetical protein